MKYKENIYLADWFSKTFVTFSNHKFSLREYFEELWRLHFDRNDDLANLEIMKNVNLAKE